MPTPLTERVKAGRSDRPIPNFATVSIRAADRGSAEDRGQSSEDFRHLSKINRHRQQHWWTPRTIDSPLMMMHTFQRVPTGKERSAASTKRMRGVIDDGEHVDEATLQACHVSESTLTQRLA